MRTQKAKAPNAPTAIYRIAVSSRTVSLRATEMNSNIQNYILHGFPRECQVIWYSIHEYKPKVHSIHGASLLWMSLFVSLRIRMEIQYIFFSSFSFYLIFPLVFSAFIRRCIPLIQSFLKKWMVPMIFVWYFNYLNFECSVIFAWVSFFFVFGSSLWWSIPAIIISRLFQMNIRQLFCYLLLIWFLLSFPFHSSPRFRFDSSNSPIFGFPLSFWAFPFRFQFQISSVGMWWLEIFKSKQFFPFFLSQLTLNELTTKQTKQTNEKEQNLSNH